jgi:hypothetical protein
MKCNVFRLCSSSLLKECSNIKKDEISGVCSTSGRDDKYIQNFNLKSSRSGVIEICLKERECEDVNWDILG